MPKILLVEDEEELRQLLVRRLQRKGFEVFASNDGEEGCALALSQHPDVILMDLRLGGTSIDGLEATSRLKAEAATRAIPVIILTADAVGDKAQECLRAGCDDYETKPINVPQLLEKIQKHLERVRVS